MTKILIIENDAPLLQLYKETFGSDGYEIETAADGLEGIEKIQSFIPDLILLDIVIPRLDGLEVLESIKRNPKTKDIPVVMLSNLSGDQIVQRVLEEGAIKYISKIDSDPKQILSIIKAVLPKKTGFENPAAPHI